MTSLLDLEYVPLRTSEGLVLYLKHTTTAWVFRLLPFRDPDQPRFWCLRVEACAGPSMSARTAPFDPFYTSLAMTREQLSETLDGIRTASATWLESTSQGDLCRWMQQVIQTPIPVDFASPPTPDRKARPRTEQTAILDGAGIAATQEAH